MTQLGSLVEINPADRRPPRNRPIAVISMADIDAESATVTPRAARNPDDVGAAHRVAVAGDVVFARISPSMENGKVAIVPELSSGLVLVSRELLVLRPLAGVDPRLIWAFLRQRSVRRHLSGLTTGSAGRRRLRPDALTQLDLAVPGDRAWARASEALDHLDEARRLARLMVVALGKLPAAAAWMVSARERRVPLVELLDRFQYGASAGSSEAGTTALLRVPNVVGGLVDTSDLRFVAGDLGSKAPVLERGDLLVVASSYSPERLGRAAVYGSELEVATFGAGLVRLTCGRRLNPDFLWAWLQTKEARAQILDDARTVGGQYRLRSAKLQHLSVPLADPDVETAVADVMGQVRSLLALGRRELDLLSALVDAHLSRVLGLFGEAAEIEPAAELTPPVTEAQVPSLVADFSAGQRQLWQMVAQLKDDFGLNEIRASEHDQARIQHSLRLFEQLGYLIRESSGQVERWRRPEEPELSA